MSTITMFRTFRFPADRVLVVAVILALLPMENAAGQGYSREEAAAKMSVADGLQVKLFAAEPEVRQPILVKMDDRGRLWTIQYLQYPNPAGLKRVKVDRWSRTVYDRVPEPPPKGPRGADKITILDDTNGDERADSFRDFVDGLNLTTGLAFGHGGVFVIQVPYLLFYPDRNRDDVPDSDPEVLLTGFGMEDSQSFANHLTWGPDGWLYGLNGSTTTCRIRGIEFQQGCWRYHPVTKEFELFCEGGGNLFGLTFDVKGNLFYSSNGGLFYHAVQGAYFQKSFGKHGPLHNLYAYGYFPNVKNSGVRARPTTGGTIYLGDSFPERFRGAFLCGDFLGHTCSWWTVSPLQTTVQAKLGGLLLDSQDTWFGPTDMCLGADGSMYVSDFHDRRTAHPDPDANWDRSNGRIFRIEAKGRKPAARFDIAKMTSEQLVDLLEHRNHWFADRARVELASRRDGSVVPRLQKQATQTANAQLALESLWALHVTAGIDEAIALTLLQYPADDVRTWTVRLLGDERDVAPAVARRFAKMAETDESAKVREQLAATARRLPGEQALPVLARLLRRDEDTGNQRIPLMLWWAIESKAISDFEDVLELFTAEETWKHPLTADCARKLIRRYAAAGSKAGYAACLQLIRSAPAAELASAHKLLAQGLGERSTGLTGIGNGGLFNQFGQAGKSELAVEKREFVPVTRELAEYIDEHWRQDRDDTFWLRLALRCSNSGAYDYVKLKVADSEAGSEGRIAMLQLLARFGREDCVPKVLPYVEANYPSNVRVAAIDALSRFAAPTIAERLIALYPRMPAGVQSAAREYLLGRHLSALQFLQLVDAGQVEPKDVPLEQLRQLTVHDDEKINALLQKHWGRITAGTPEEKLATMRRFNNDLHIGGGNWENGRRLFEKNCAVCHQLFGKGNKIGPDLTGTTRKDRAALLANIVDPNAVIRRDYLNSVIVTASGRVLTGLITKRDGGSLTIADSKGKLTTLSQSDVEEIRTSPISLMPEQMLEKLKPQELRDLFQYLQSDGK